MIRDRHGIEYPDIFSAINNARAFDKKYNEAFPAARHEQDLADLRADLDAIIASAQGALAAAGLPRDVVRARALGECV